MGQRDRHQESSRRQTCIVSSITPAVCRPVLSCSRLMLRHCLTYSFLLLLTAYSRLASCSTSPSASTSAAGDMSELLPRQDDLETRTLSSMTSSLQPQGGPSQTASPTSTYRLETARPPLQLPDTIGLIMPDPWSKIYVGKLAFARRDGVGPAEGAGLNYSLGFVDAIPRPAPTIGGWLRQVQPLLMLPNYRVSCSVYRHADAAEIVDRRLPLDREQHCGRRERSTAWK